MLLPQNFLPGKLSPGGMEREAVKRGKTRTNVCTQSKSFCNGVKRTPRVFPVRVFDFESHKEWKPHDRDYGTEAQRRNGSYHICMHTKRKSMHNKQCIRWLPTLLFIFYTYDMVHHSHASCLCMYPSHSNMICRYDMIQCKIRNAPVVAVHSTRCLLMGSTEQP